MKISEMTNEELAKNIDEFANAFHNDSDKSILREAAARLRRNCKRCQIESIDREAEANTLRAKLKVAEDALEDLVDEEGIVCDCEIVYKANNVIAMIRGEGGNDEQH